MGMKDIVDSTFNYIKDTILPQAQAGFQSFWNYIQPILQEFGGFFNQHLAPLIQAFVDLILKVIFPFFVASLKAQFDFIKGIIEIGIGFFTYFGDQIKQILTGIINFITGFINLLVGIFTGNKAKVDEGARQMLGGITGIFKGIMDAAGKVIYETIMWVVGFMTEKVEWVRQKASEMAGAVASVSNKASDLGNKVQDAVNRSRGGNFASGGIVPGSSYTGDRVQINANSGEMILTRTQQTELFNQLNGKSSGGKTGGSVFAPVINLPVQMFMGTERERRQLADQLVDAVFVKAKERGYV